MLSTPVWGVAMRKETTAPLLAPSRRRDMAVGMTPHEQRGSGTPKMAALMTERKVLPLKYFVYHPSGMKACMMPARRNPKSR